MLGHLSDTGYTKFKPLDHTGGFISVPASGPAVTAHGPVAEPVERVQPLCANDYRDGMLTSGTVNPQTGQAVEPCSMPGAPSPPGGGGGGGSQ